LDEGLVHLPDLQYPLGRRRVRIEVSHYQYGITDADSPELHVQIDSPACCESGLRNKDEQLPDVDCRMEVNERELVHRAREQRPEVRGPKTDACDGGDEQAHADIEPMRRCVWQPDRSRNHHSFDERRQA
jgi:hypothetical protein